MKKHMEYGVQIPSRSRNTIFLQKFLFCWRSHLYSFPGKLRRWYCIGQAAGGLRATYGCFVGLPPTRGGATGGTFQKKDTDKGQDKDKDKDKENHMVALGDCHPATYQRGSNKGDFPTF